MHGHFVFDKTNIINPATNQEAIAKKTDRYAPVVKNEAEKKPLCRSKTIG
jgi:hypothetical protein